MDCHSIREKIFAFLDGESPPGDIRELEEHFHHCFPCYQRLTLQRALGKLVRARTQGSDLPAGMEARLRVEIEKRARAQGRTPLLDRPVMWLLAAAAVFLAVGLTAAIPVVRPAGPQHVTLRGNVVCLGCECARCQEQGGAHAEHVHENGLRTTEGRLLKILETETTKALLHDESARGRRCTVHGTVYDSAGIIQVESINF